MKKLRITAFLLSAVLALPLLTSCHGSRKLDPFVMPEAFDTEKQYEITFLAKSDTNVAQTNIYKKTIADFEALYPNIKVKLDIYTDYGKIYNYVITNIATQTTPNVCITYPDHIATYLTSPDTVVCLDDLFFDERYGLGGSELRYDGPSYDELIPKFLASITQCPICARQKRAISTRPLWKSSDTQYPMSSPGTSCLR